jgi:hypothetical protein
VLFAISAALLVSLVPAGFFLRRRIMGGNGGSQEVTPGSFLSGTIVFLALCEAASLASIVAALLRGSLIPAALPAFISMAVQLMNFPRGEELAGRA